MMKFSRSLVGVCCVLALAGCYTQPGEKTGVGAATGGVIGAGLGAIVGNQVGSPGAGIAIGAAAGASAGAAIGNALQAQDERMAALEEQSNRREETIRSQNAELNQLRAMPRDSGSAGWNGSAYGASSGSFAGASKKHDGAGVRQASPEEIAAARSRLRQDAMPAPRAQLNSELPSASVPTVTEVSQRQAAPVAASSSSISERNLIVGVQPSLPPAQEAPVVDQVAAVSSSAPSSVDCNNAEVEVGKATAATDSADKLFHLRRALRLCPDNAPFHIQLGELYLSLNRQEDARYEYNEALRIDPSSEAATTGLERASNQTKSASAPAVSGLKRY